jgi:23S rRNA (guanosine2251-2'-O)-methyltransferase
VAAALANPARRKERLVLSPEAARGTVLNPSTGAGKGQALKVEILPREAIAALLPEGAVHQGAALLADPLEAVGLETLLRKTRDLEEAALVVLDQATDPRNIGAVARSAAALGAAGVILTERGAPKVTGALAKAASGAIEHIALVRVTNLARTLGAMKKSGFWCAGLDAEGTESLAQANLSGRIALVLGGEGGGLRRLTAEHCDFVARIPIAPRAGSLNLAAAAAIALHEWARRRTV